MTAPSLSLQEHLLLLSLDDETGIPESPYQSYGLNAAALAELLLRDRLVLEAATLVAKDTRPTGDAALDLALAGFRTVTRPRTLAWWIRCLYRDLAVPRDSLIANLVARGILRPEAGRPTWMYYRNVYPTADPTPERQMRAQIREAVFGDAPVEDRVAVCIALLEGCRSLDLIFSRQERIQRKERIQFICESHPIGHAVGEAVAEVIAEDDHAGKTPVLAVVTDRTATKTPAS